MKQIYTSGVFPLQPKKKGAGHRDPRGYVMWRASVFEIRTGIHDYGDRIVIQLHSSKSRKHGEHASTEVILNRNEAEHLLAGLLAAMSDAT